MMSLGTKAWSAGLSRVGAPIAVGLACFAAASLSLALTRGLHAIAAMWPANAVLLAGVLLAPRRDTWRYLAAGVVASLAGNLSAGGSLAMSAAFTSANVAEVALVTWLLRRQGVPLPSFMVPHQVVRFCVAASAASLLSMTIATALGGRLSVAFAASWFAADLLGLLVVTPIILIWADLIRGWRHGEQTLVDLLAAVGTLVAFGVLTTFAFGQSTYPLLFLPLAALMIATYRLGPLGAASGVLVIAVVGSLLTGIGRGPIALVHGDARASLYLFQIYLLVLLASALPVAALQAARDRLHRRASEAIRMLGLAERAAQVGHWRLDVKHDELFWSPEVFRVHGVAESNAPSLATAIDAYHPDDRAAVSAAVQRTLGTGAPFDLEARIVRPDGSVRHVATKGWAEQAATGGVGAIFGVFQDITHHVDARQSAERQVTAATELADTDSLTGLPNRRKSTRLIDEALAAARTSGWPFCVAMVDVDHFKSVNDRFGHTAGDWVLQRLARVAQDVLRGGDVIGRLGGEEFILLLPGADAEDALAAAERVRAAVEASGAGTPADPKVTVSLGVAEWAGEEAGALMSRADRALYDAKNAGRNALRLAA